jgi:glycerol-3-phosphate dehydrogenase
MKPEYDLVIIGGGINGCGIARDAEDILWRRTKCGLHLARSERDAAATHIRQTVERMPAGGT